MSSSAHKNLQRQILQKAIDAIDNAHADEKDITAMTMAIDIKKNPEARKLIAKFRRDLCAYLEHGQQLRTRVGITDNDAQTINSNAKKLTHLMDDPGATPISMVEQDLVDASGASKVALFDVNAFKIQVTRAKWKALSDEDKFVVAALELFGLSRVQDRYSVAGIVKQEFQQIEQMSEVVDQNWSYLTAVKVGGVVTYEAPGIFKSLEEIFPMATNLSDVDIHRHLSQCEYL